MKLTTAAAGLALSHFLLLVGSAGAQNEALGWTGVLDEASFAALHELKQGAAPELFGQAIEINGDKAYLSLPRVGPPIGGVVVIHEWWGLNDHVKHWADRLAADGYAAVAVDLYGGVVAETREEAMKSMQAVDGERAVATLRSAHGLLVNHPLTQAERTASIGWCFGGGMSLALAMSEPELDAAILYYGRLVSDPEQLAAIEAPILGIFGLRDAGIPPAAVDEFAAAMKAAGKTLTTVQYDADHAFANPSSGRYDAEHAASAWQRSRAFLAEQLMPSPGEGSYSSGTRTLASWTPEGWKAETGRPMRLLSYKIGAGTECSVIVLPGSAGGLKANLDRWRGQVGNEAFDEAEVAALPRIPMLGRLATTMRADGKYTDMSGNGFDSATLVGSVCELENETVFVKLVGPQAEVEAELDAFAAFCRSLE